MSIAASSMFPGFRFCPTDEELISYYLRKKLDGHEDSVQVISEVELCNFEPWDLPVNEEDCYAEILKDDIIKLDDSSFSKEDTKPQDPSQMQHHPSPSQGTANRRIRLKVRNPRKKSPSGGVPLPSSRHSSKNTLFTSVEPISNLGIMSRPMLLVFLLIILIITSQFEWKQQLVPDVDSNPGISQKQHQITKGEDTVKEKIILVQEKNIRRLNELVRHLQEQLQQCRLSNETTNGTVSPLAERILELEQQQILED
ncbi:hypothetical protein RIF29_27494 [Crotalaria pallida]|uniref:NAC domain-containing protein n=1 Tax=Crotalaria pallida TaxID=3830 RepID=A0AAN9I130_CROPI